MSKEWFRKNLANIITCLRIIGTGVMAFLPTLSTSFYIVYAFAGATDVLDGFVARRLGTVSKFGSKLDSFSDLFFFITMMLKILPLLVIYLPRAIMITIYSIFAVRVAIYLFVWIAEHRFQSSHAYLNKATGFLLYFVPFMIKTRVFTFFAGFICAIAALAAAYELKLIGKSE